MPPRKRTISTNNGNGDQKVTKRTRKSAQLPSNGEPHPQVIDTYKPLSKTSADKTIKGVLQSIYGRKKADQDVGLRLLISSTEGDILLGPPGESHIEWIAKQSQVKVLEVTDKIEASVDREVVLLGNAKQVVHATALVAFTLGSILETCTTDTLFHLTLLVPECATQGLERLNVELSSEFLPFSNYKTVYANEHLPKLTETLKDVVSHIHDSVTDSTVLIHPQGIPIVGTHLTNQTPETTQRLLNQSRDLFVKFINKDYTHLLSKEDDPKQHSLETIEEAEGTCQEKIKDLEPIKQVIDIPLDSVSNVIGRGGFKIKEIRSKSNSNVVIGDSIKDNKYRTVTLTGLPEGNLTALRYLKGLV
ncbi:unnamed protein product [Cyberlindnera jadinii]|uniref:K Homology domain-containing protein n=1 Tax=Cyberlindnera jadinii (strain ATCC 18201 / CBS 1600 / BCRC 20928 / JCM 3617 / NBRC 0987 / NRRL Y-1542) TaxID=983966 RepID=A0A0H5BZZ0_CYBJN|nr:hypothetical protein CYBJADRAFT_165596 [Cyberlindnera jadinii NRRL Y-1542]ODV76291.1 hypothetical protein CYBJADRAFT_165596 [Cyberlindnera jadinii NRRL Y-1542]CEP20941.1 unnamed protein product [Cyberlindnera jadinii]